jgi:hypothetical protein
MGLDMYLTAEKYFWRDRKEPRIGCIPKGFEAASVTVEAAYWRKSNQIHAWFVKNVQNGVDNCEKYDVSHSQLLELRDVCVTVLGDLSIDLSIAPILLPVEDGFFFGSNDYDEVYFGDLQSTVNQIDKIMIGFDSRIWNLTYHASW